MHPTFLLILDVAFGLLLCVFLALLFLTRGHLHIFILIGIEGCLWASVKWCALFSVGISLIPLPYLDTLGVRLNIVSRFVMELNLSVTSVAEEKKEKKE